MAKKLIDSYWVDGLGLVEHYKDVPDSELGNPGVVSDDWYDTRKVSGDTFDKFMLSLNVVLFIALVFATIASFT